MIVVVMAASDTLILDVLKELSGRKATYAEIAERCRVVYSEKTVERAIKRLEQTGRVQRVGNGKGNAKGFSYAIK